MKSGHRQSRATTKITTRAAQVLTSGGAPAQLPSSGSTRPANVQASQIATSSVSNDSASAVNPAPHADRRRRDAHQQDHVVGRCHRGSVRRHDLGREAVRRQRRRRRFGLALRVVGARRARDTCLAARPVARDGRLVAERAHPLASRRALASSLKLPSCTAQSPFGARAGAAWPWRPPPPAAARGGEPSSTGAGLGRLRSGRRLSRPGGSGARRGGRRRGRRARRGDDGLRLGRVARASAVGAAASGSPSRSVCVRIGTGSSAAGNCSDAGSRLHRVVRTVQHPGNQPHADRDEHRGADESFLQTLVHVAGRSPKGEDAQYSRSASVAAPTVTNEPNTSTRSPGCAAARAAAHAASTLRQRCDALQHRARSSNAASSLPLAPRSALPCVTNQRSASGTNGCSTPREILVAHRGEHDEGAPRGRQSLERRREPARRGRIVAHVEHPFHAVDAVPLEPAAQISAARCPPPARVVDGQLARHALDDRRAGGRVVELLLAAERRQRQRRRRVRRRRAAPACAVALASRNRGRSGAARRPRRARASSTLAGTFRSAITTGLPRRTIPAFSRPIASRVVAEPLLVIEVDAHDQRAIGVDACSWRRAGRPCRPREPRRPRARRAKCSSAATADDSKYDSVIVPSVESIDLETARRARRRSASAPLKRMRSLKRHRCGDVNAPTS